MRGASRAPLSHVESRRARPLPAGRPDPSKQTIGQHVARPTMRQETVSDYSSVPRRMVAATVK